MDYIPNIPIMPQSEYEKVPYNPQQAFQQQPQQAFQQQPQQTFQQQTFQQQPQQVPQAVKQGITVLSLNEVRHIAEQLKPVPMTAPVKITEASYVLTEEQMRQLLTVGNVSGVPGLPNSGKRNVIDSVGNITFGTVGRIGHTFTHLADNLVDILTLGYSKK